MAPQINRTLRLPENQYLHSETLKSGIAIHHTAGGSARSTFNWWLEDPRAIGTAYMIARDGTIHELFDPKCWAWQFGLEWDDEDTIAFEKRFIGIEIASEGRLKEANDQLYAFDVVSPRTLKPHAEAFEADQMYRGYRYFDKYEIAQIDSLIDLINHLSEEFNIPKQVPREFFKYYGSDLQDFIGIIGHAMVRKDKSDPAPDLSMWNRILNECEANAVNIDGQRVSTGRALTDVEKEALFERNVQQINTMDVAAGSMVKGLIMELGRKNRNTIIRLFDAVAGGHEVSYDFIQGDRGLVFRIANALGFQNVTDSKLEVRHV